MIESTVLITTAIRPPAMPYLEMRDAATRIIATKSSIFFWAAQGVRNLVIADATDTPVLSAEEITLLQQMRINIEQIHYAQDSSLISRLGKGYAEGKLIGFAVENSRLLAQEEFFFKCTGKVMCRNFLEIDALIKQHKLRGMFWKLWHDMSVTTALDARFFFVSKAFFKEHLALGYALSNDTEGKIAESTCAMVLNECRLPQSQAIRPLLSGFAGGTGKQYDEETLGKLDQNFPCWFQLM